MRHRLKTYQLDGGTDIQTVGQQDRQTDRQKDRQTDRETDRKREREKRKCSASLPDNDNAMRHKGQKSHIVNNKIL